MTIIAHQESNLLKYYVAYNLQQHASTIDNTLLNKLFDNTLNFDEIITFYVDAEQLSFATEYPFNEDSMNTQLSVGYDLYMYNTLLASPTLTHIYNDDMANRLLASVMLAVNYFPFYMKDTWNGEDLSKRMFPISYSEKPLGNYGGPAFIISQEKLFKVILRNMKINGCFDLIQNNLITNMEVALRAIKKS